MTYLYCFERYMKKKNLIILLVLVLLVAGGLALRHYTHWFSHSKSYIGYYHDVRGLQEASAVYYKGVKVGKVNEIDLNIRKKVRVVLEIEGTLKITRGSKAIITSGDVNGTKSIRLTIPAGQPVVAEGSTLHTGFDSTVSENFHAKISPMIQTGKYMLHSADSALLSFNNLLRSGWGNETRKGFASANKDLEQLAVSSADARRGVTSFGNTLNKLDSSTRRPEERNKNTNKSLNNAEENTAKARQQDAGKSLRELQASIASLSRKIEAASHNKILTDKEAYERANRQLDSLNRSMEQYAKDPPPLINIGFGGGKK